MVMYLLYPSPLNCKSLAVARNQFNLASSLYPRYLACQWHHLGTILSSSSYTDSVAAHLNLLSLQKPKDQTLVIHAFSGNSGSSDGHVIGEPGLTRWTSPTFCFHLFDLSNCFLHQSGLCLRANLVTSGPTK